MITDDLRIKDLMSTQDIARLIEYIRTFPIKDAQLGTAVVFWLTENEQHDLYRRVADAMEPIDFVVCLCTAIRAHIPLS